MREQIGEWREARTKLIERGDCDCFSSPRHPLNPLYSKFHNIKQRCYNPNNPAYPSYGGKGIKICDKWISDFAVFKDWALVNGCKKKLVLHRINPDDDYRPGNCKFVSKSENSKKVWPDRLERIELEEENKRLRRENKKLRGWGWRLARGVL